jgi:hypothetical protein
MFICAHSYHVIVLNWILCILDIKQGVIFKGGTKPFTIKIYNDIHVVRLFT